MPRLLVRIRNGTVVKIRHRLGPLLGRLPLRHLFVPFLRPGCLIAANYSVGTTLKAKRAPTGVWPILRLGGPVLRKNSIGRFWPPM